MYDFRAGEVLLINKPLTWTSFQVVNKMKYAIKHHPSLMHEGKRIQPKIGHAGTLDPLATGLLIVCTGKQTKNIESYQAQEKEYTGTFYIGATTPCYDLEKEIDAHYPTEHITDELIRETTKQFMGKIQQTPPLFSAIKIDGKRAYDIARAGKTAEIKSKEIEIKEFEITRIALPEVDFRVVCSKGTYIRSLARDFGLALNSGAHLTALCRTRIGEYKLSDAMSLEDFQKPLSV
ncbi:MAG: tRNA pseudouridine(55) synthase TruB [Bacteroidia bacterium]|nr:tRNA pseudouridine(55) synthase TruB [Bacteroidia bacterium]